MSSFADKVFSALMEDFRDAVDFAKIAEEKRSVALHSAQTIQTGQMSNDLLEQMKKPMPFIKRTSTDSDVFGSRRGRVLRRNAGFRRHPQ